MNSPFPFCVCLIVLGFVGGCERSAIAADFPMLGRDATRNAVSPEKNPPIDWAVGTWIRKTDKWDHRKSRNFKWKAKLGNFTFGTPIVAGGQVYIGANDAGGHVKRHFDGRFSVWSGYLHCFRAADGKFLWQYSAKELETHGWRYGHPGLGSSPLVEGNRLWFVSNRGEVVCLDTKGFHDGEDDGPVKDRWRVLFEFGTHEVGAGASGALKGLERGLLTVWLRKQFELVGIRLPDDAKVAPAKGGKRYRITAKVRGRQQGYEVRLEGDKPSVWKAVTIADKDEADIVWRYDMIQELKVYPYSHFFWNANRQCSPASYGDRLFVVTGNGRKQRSSQIPSPKAPSLICFDKKTGKVLWTDASPGENILMGQFSDPLVAEIKGRAQVIVGQGDGWVRSFDALTGKLIWKFDINAKESVWKFGQGTRNSILATPVLYKGRVYVGSGQVADFSGGPGRLVCIDPTKTGDISSELAVDAAGRALPQRRYQAVKREKGERAIRNPNSGLIWDFTRADRNKNGEDDYGDRFLCTLSSVAVKNDLLVAVDASGLVHCFHAGTGKRFWVYDMFAEATGSPLIVDDWVYVPNRDGSVAIFKLSADPDVAMKKVKGNYHPRAENGLGGSGICGSPVFANGVLYVATGSNLWAIARPNKTP